MFFLNNIRCTYSQTTPVSLRYIYIYFFWYTYLPWEITHVSLALAYLSFESMVLMQYAYQTGMINFLTTLAPDINIYILLIYVLLCSSLLDVLEVVAPFKQFQKLRDFMMSKLPSGFPVRIGKLNLPKILPSILFGYQ